MSLPIDTQAPEFTLPDQTGTNHTLSQYKGQWVVLYFYPKDDTPVCTIEACSFRDMADEYKKHDVVILGMSKDSVKSHTKFAVKHQLSFPLLSDESAETIKAYDVWGMKKFMGREFEGIHRVTYLIDPRGMIRKVYDKIKATEQPEEILKDIQSFTA
ncbi:MAG: thioredoxin-dependent thiol peroxidase [Weeksellaceae bacterium]